MPNTFLKPEVIAATALGLLQRELVIPRLIWLNGIGDFAGAKDDTISIRVPGRAKARRRNLRATGADRNIVTDTLSETKIDVTLDTDIYHAVPVTDEELTLDITNFGVQILAPQTRSIVEGFEEDCVEYAIRAAPYQATVVIDPAKTYDGFVDARKALNDENVPFAQRFALVGSGIEAACLKDPQFVEADKSGSTDALREALLGRIAGCDVYTSNALDDDEGYMFHRTAYIAVTRAPMVPDGASFGASQSYEGLAMRWLRDYDFLTTTDRSLVDTYAGFGFTTEGEGGPFVRAVRLMRGTQSITVSPTTMALAVGGTGQVTVRDDGGDPVTPKSATYTTSDPTKATVSTSGKVTGVAAGSATITATYQGRTATVAVTVA